MSKAEPARVFAALGDPTRLSLLIRLSDARAASLSALAQGGSLTRQAVTKHLRVLEQAGLVRSERAGRESLYACRPDGLTGARDWLEEISRQWDEALGRLKAFVED